MVKRTSFRWSGALVDCGRAGGGRRLFDLVGREDRSGRYEGVEFLRVRARTIINRVPPGTMPFQYTINPYRGCSHACTYCFARPTHTYLGFGPGEDFNRRIVVKVNAPELARAELHPKRWAGHWVAMGTNTDPYQPAEAKFGLTRGVIEALAEVANPFSILTKSGLVLRDLDVLRTAAARAPVRVDLSIATLDAEIWRATEPGTPHPALRLRALARLRDAGIDAGVLVAPLLPGLSDGADQVEAVVRAALAAGATAVGTSVLHLRPGVRSHFIERLAASHPSKVSQYERWYRQRNAPASLVEVIERRFHGIVARAGGPASNRWRPEDFRRRAGPSGPSAGRAAPAAEQLALPLSVS